MTIVTAAKVQKVKEELADKSQLVDEKNAFKSIMQLFYVNLKFHNNFEKNFIE